MPAFCVLAYNFFMFDKLGISKKTFIFITLIFLLTRILLTLVGVVSRELYSKRVNWHYSDNKSLNVWGNWDSGWYLSISEYGYEARKSSYPDTYNQVSYNFFPAYPLIIRYITKLTNNYLLSGVIVSNLALFLSCFLLYKLVLLDYDHNHAIRAVKFLLIYPTSFFLSGALTEGLFIFLLLLTYYMFRTRRYITSSVSGFFLALTRSVGVVAVIPLLIDGVKRCLLEKKLDYKLVFSLISLPFGLFIYGLYNINLTGNFFGFVESQKSWGRVFRGPLYYLWSGMANRNVGDMVTVVYVVLVLALLVLLYKKMCFSYLILTVLYLFVPLSSSLDGMFRYSVVAFPLYIALSILGKNKIVDLTLTLGFVVLQVILMLMWVGGFKLLV